MDKDEMKIVRKLANVIRMQASQFEQFNYSKVSKSGVENLVARYYLICKSI